MLRCDLHAEPDLFVCYIAGTVEYFYKKVGAWQKSSHGKEIFYFANGQREVHHLDESKEILYNDGRCCVSNADGEEGEVAHRDIPKALLVDSPAELFA